MLVTSEMKYDIRDLSDRELQTIINCMYLAIVVSESERKGDPQGLAYVNQLELAKDMLGDIRLSTGKHE